MAAEYIRTGKITRCREVTRTQDANGNIVETWGDFLPLSYCGFDGRMVPGSRRQVAKNPDGTLGDFDEIITGDKNPATDGGAAEARKGFENYFLLIVAAVFGVGVLAVLVFKK